MAIPWDMAILMETDTMVSMFTAGMAIQIRRKNTTRKNRATGKVSSKCSRLKFQVLSCIVQPVPYNLEPVTDYRTAYHKPRSSNPNDSST